MWVVSSGSCSIGLGYSVVVGEVSVSEELLLLVSTKVCGNSTAGESVKLLSVGCLIILK